MGLSIALYLEVHLAGPIMTHKLISTPLHLAHYHKIPTLEDSKRKKKWKKKNMLETGIFSFSQSVFYHIKNESYHLGQFKLSSANAFQLDKTSELPWQGFFWILTLKLPLTVSQTIPGFYVSAVQVFENTVGKG